MVALEWLRQKRLANALIHPNRQQFFALVKQYTGAELSDTCGCSYTQHYYSLQRELCKLNNFNPLNF